MWSILAIHPMTVSRSDCVTIFTKPHRNHNHRRNTLLWTTFSDEIFRRPPFQLTSNPTRASLSDLPSDGSLTRKPFSKCRQGLISSPMLIFTRRRMVAREELFSHAPPPKGLSVANEQIQPLHEPLPLRKSPHFPLFLSVDCFWAIMSPESPLLLYFLKLYDTFKTLGVVSIDYVDFVDLLLISHLYDCKRRLYG